MRLWRVVLGLCTLGALSGGAAARLVEEQLDVPVQVANAWGKPVAQSIRVTVFSDDANPRPAPIALISHGRATSPEGRARVGRVRFAEAARWLVARGFVVAVPTRVGYGLSGGDDVEDSGRCADRQYPPVFAAAASQVRAVLAVVQQRADVAPERVLLIGQSFGGLTTVALAAQNPPGVQAAINFAGGAGGDPKAHAQQPCSPARVEALFSRYGNTARVPMLWVYTENDQFFGPRLPRDWLAAFQRGGGRADWVQLPPHGADGHRLFADFPQVWQPIVAAFLDAHGFPAAR